jgi:hypothetical protein
MIIIIVLKLNQEVYSGQSPGYLSRPWLLVKARVKGWVDLD